MSLREYTKKRNFSRTAEPQGARAAKGRRRFVVQKHEATRLHYDFRLELDGALKSWAVPKGMPLVHGEKRLAMHVEDHPVAYIDFEGTIPKGEYGGGTVMVWDHGTFEPLTRSPLKDLEKGKLHFVLHGEKLEGEWYLVQMRGGEEWLLVRGGDTARRPSRKREDTSVLSGKSMKQLATMDREKPPAASRNRRALPAPSFVEPMKAKLVAAPPTTGDWRYEIKFDGFRALALCGTRETRLLSRNEKDLGGKFPEVLEAVSGLKVRDALLDGEIVALDSKGRSSFQLLQQFEMGTGKAPLFYYVFDLLRLDGADLRSRPLAKRRAMLESILPAAGGLIRYSAALGTDASALLKKAARLGLEGLIGKREDSRYESGRRSGAWIKLKLHREQEFVIGGFTDPEGSRRHFGALIVGVHQRGRLVFCGKVGTGFSQAMLRDLHGRLSRLESGDCPFADLPQPRSTRYGQAITASEMKRCHWAEPQLVAQVRFAEWTQDHHLRQPVYLGLREDKDAAEVVREKP